MNDKIVKIDEWGIEITLCDPELHALKPTRYNGGSISSKMKEVCPHCNDPLCDFDCPDALEWSSDRDMDCQNDNNAELAGNRNYNYAMDALTSMILSHACAGIDVTTPEYSEGIRTACESCAQNT